MRKYTDADVLAYWDANMGVQKTRKREYIDPRNYVIAILHYKFGYTEFDLADIFEIDRCSVNWGKKQPYYHIYAEDDTFAKHTKDLVDKFPYIFTEHVKHTTGGKSAKLINVNMKLPMSIIQSLREDGAEQNLSVRLVAEEIIKKHYHYHG